MSNPQVPPPWPLMPECRDRHFDWGIRCTQHDGSHEHDWAGWDGEILTAGQWSRGGVSVRCTICGGRKCDMTMCREQRHHVGPHSDMTGAVIRQVGA